MEDDLVKVFRCVYCDKTFVREPWFKKHTCKKKQVFSNLTDLETISAMQLFKTWCKRNFPKKKINNVDDFKKSPYADIFTELVSFTRDNWISSNRFTYLNWLIDNNVNTNLWCNDNTAQNFREWVARHDDYMTQVRSSIAFIQSWCSEKSRNWYNFFEEVGLGDALYLISTYKISPWILLGYDYAVIDLLQRFSDEMILELNQNIQLYYWVDKINENIDRKIEINNYCIGVFNVS